MLLLWALPRAAVLHQSWLRDETWFPPPDAAFWVYLGWFLLALVVLFAVRFVFKLAVYLWREMSD